MRTFFNNSKYFFDSSSTELILYKKPIPKAYNLVVYPLVIVWSSLLLLNIMMIDKMNEEKIFLILILILQIAFLFYKRKVIKIEKSKVTIFNLFKHQCFRDELPIFSLKNKVYKGTIDYMKTNSKCLSINFQKIKKDIVIMEIFDLKKEDEFESFIKICTQIFNKQ